MLNVARMCGNREVRYAQEVPGGDSGYLKTVEVLSAHLLENALQCRTQAICLNGTESAGPDFVRHKKGVPPGCVYLPVKRESIQFNISIRLCDCNFAASLPRSQPFGVHNMIIIPFSSILHPLISQFLF